MASTSFTAESSRNQFLQLFATQLRNQDPLEPTRQEDFLLQLAQFSMVEGMENMNSKLDKLIVLQQQRDGASSNGPAYEELATATALLGKTVETVNGYSGVVKGIQQVDGKSRLLTGDQLLSLEDIRRVLN